jgi:hypothetical protein
MRRQIIDRMADTVVFRMLLFLSGLVVLPVLMLGVLFSALFLPSWRSASNSVAAAFLLLSAGGAIGVTGWLRALRGIRAPEHHNIDLTMICLAIGILTALSVGSVTTVEIVAELHGERVWATHRIVLWSAFVVAHGLWILSGIAWMQRLARSYAERTSRSFDALPVALLLIALGLALTVAFVSVCAL